MARLRDSGSRPGRWAPRPSWPSSVNGHSKRLRITAKSRLGEKFPAQATWSSIHAATLAVIAAGYPHAQIDDLLPWNFKPSSWFRVGPRCRSDVFFQGSRHAIWNARAFVAVWTPKGGHEV